MNKIIPLLACHPEIYALLAHDMKCDEPISKYETSDYYHSKCECSKYVLDESYSRDGHLIDFAIYDNDYLAKFNDNWKMFGVICKLFYLDKNKSFSQFSGELTYPSLIDIQWTPYYHKIIAYIDPDHIYYTDYCFDRKRDKFLTFKMEESEVIDMLRRLNKKELTEEDINVIYDVLRVGQSYIHNGITVRVAKIDKYYTCDELFRLMDDAVENIYNLCINPDTVRSISYDDSDVDPTIHELIYRHTDNILFAHLVRYLSIKKLDKLKREIDRKYQWL